MSGFDASASPDPVTFVLQASTVPPQGSPPAPEQVNVGVVQLPHVSVSVKPGTGMIVGGALVGTFAGMFIGGGITVGLLYAVAKIIGDKMTDAINDKLSDQNLSFTLPLDSLGYSFDVEGVTIKIEAASLELGTFAGQLMADGTVKVD